MFRPPPHLPAECFSQALSVRGHGGPLPSAGYSLAILSWLLFLSIFLRELGSYSPSRTFLWRFPIFLIFAGQLAKLK